MPDRDTTRGTYWRLPFGPVTESTGLVDFDVREAFPELSPRVDDLDQSGIEQRFREADGSALRDQRRYRRFQFWIILGAATTSFFGALQFVIISPAAFTAVAIAVAGIGTSGIAQAQRTSGPLNKYLVARSTAERLRSLYFRYLCAGERGDPGDLEADVTAIVYPSERGRVG